MERWGVESLGHSLHMVWLFGSVLGYAEHERNICIIIN